MIRLAKSALIGALGLFVTVFALNNIANFSTAISHVGYVLSQADHTVYPVSLFPALNADLIVTATLCLIIAAELATGVVLLKGGLDLFRARAQAVQAFEDAKSAALLGCLMAIGVWFGLFMVLGGTFYQMWQTPLGRGSFDDSYTMVMVAGMMFLIVRSPDAQARSS